MIARAESGQARGNMDDFDAAEVARDIQELYEPLAEDSGMSLRVKTAPAPVHGNRELISQALANLVENAIKYGKPAGTVQPLRPGAAAAAASHEIVIEARRDGDSVLLSVTDRGPGIPEADRKHAVERFVRLEASRTLPGSGLGLSLASAVATLHGGELRLGDAHPGLSATLVDPGASRRRGQACGPNAGCATEGGMNSSAKGDADRHRLAARFVDGPHVSAPDQAEQRLEDWLSDLEPAQSAAIDVSPVISARQSHPARHRRILALSVRSGARRCRAAIRLLRCDPEPHLDRADREDLRATSSAAADEAEVMQLLRRMKAEAALLIALCDIGGVWPVMQVTAALTDLAVASVQAALRFLLRQEAARGRMKPPDPEAPEEGSGLVVLAMGKMGAGELNYSSDIDLIVFFDPAAPTLAPDIEPQPFFVRVTQAMARLLQQRSGDGYVFRVDLRLRPDPASTQVAISTGGALHYYEREGRTWERAAMIKARPCAGDAKAGEAMIAEIAPFVWRKHLDFAALADVHDMKRQMQTFRGQSEIAVEGHNVKVGRGGIREIEFFAQTQQLIAGGRHPELRVRPTLEALDVLASSNWITFEARDELTAAYLFLRRVEHRLQMIADEQTHALPEDAEAVERFACFFGYEEPRRVRQRPARPSQHRAGALQPAVRGRSDRHRKTAGRRLRRRSRRSAPARTSGRARLQEAGGGGENRAAMDDRRLSRAARRGDAQRLRRIHSRPDRRPRACRGARRCGGGVRPFPAGAAARRAADFAARARTATSSRWWR